MGVSVYKRNLITIRANIGNLCWELAPRTTNLRRQHMKNLSFKTILLITIALALPLLVSAQATRTWVSGVGDDVNPCSRTAPCKTFAGAISKTATNGEINCLDPAGYGTINITKSITIDCEDTQGSILASGVTGVIINITNAADVKKAVKIRGISINGAGSTLNANGIRVLAANTVVIEDGVIDGFQTHGISVETTSGTPKIVVDRMSIRSVNGNGINTFITGGTVQLSVSNSTIASTATGVNLSSNTKAVVRASNLVNNSTGALAFQSDLQLFGCTISGNTTGVTSLTGGVVRIHDNVITSNGTGLSSSGGSILSSGQNELDGNTTNGGPTGFLT